MPTQLSLTLWLIMRLLTNAIWPLLKCIEHTFLFWGPQVTQVSSLWYRSRCFPALGLLTLFNSVMLVVFVGAQASWGFFVPKSSTLSFSFYNSIIHILLFKNQLCQVFSRSSTTNFHGYNLLHIPVATNWYLCLSKNKSMLPCS